MLRTDRMNQLLQMLEKEPSDPFLNHALALEYFSLGNFEEAKKIFEQLLNENKNYLPSYYHLGQTLEKLEENAGAIKIYKAGIELATEQKNNKAKNELGEALWLLED
jgi:tetratricopeptide (TPR) repeat protein